MSVVQSILAPDIPMLAADTRPMVAVDFVVPKTIGARFAELLAEFVQWVPLPMDRQPDGSHTVTVWLEAGRSWRYQFLIDEAHLINDWNAEQYDDAETSCFAVINT